MPTLGERLVKIATKLEALAPIVLDLDKRVRRLEKAAWTLVGAVALLEFIRACN